MYQVSPTNLLYFSRQTQMSLLCVWSRCQCHVWFSGVSPRDDRDHGCISQDARRTSLRRWSRWLAVPESRQIHRAYSLDQRCSRYHRCHQPIRWSNKNTDVRAMTWDWTRFLTIWPITGSRHEVPTRQYGSIEVDEKRIATFDGNDRDADAFLSRTFSD